MNTQVYDLVNWPQHRSYGIRLNKWVGGYPRQFDCVRIKLLFEFVRVRTPDGRRRPFGMDTRLIGGWSAYVAALTESQQVVCKEKQEQIGSHVYPILSYDPLLCIRLQL